MFQPPDSLKNASSSILLFAHYRAARLSTQRRTRLESAATSCRARFFSLAARPETPEFPTYPILLSYVI
jgi:hypothetical protein